MIYESGKCPECGCENVNYGRIEWNDDSFDPQVMQEAECIECGCQFIEYHNTSYDRSKVTWHGNADNAKIS